MAVNFRLAYNNGTKYVDLFPKTSADAIVGVDNALEYTTIDVTIPAVASGTTQQTVTITTTPTQVAAPVDMVLTSTGSQALSDYGTITQFEVQTNALVITRLYSWPTDSIQVTLYFKEGGVV